LVRVEHGIDYIAMKSYAPQKFSRCVCFCWNDLNNRFIPLGHDKRLSSTGNFAEEGKAVGLKLTGGYGFGLTTQGQII
jgi:hypothetical protein